MKEWLRSIPAVHELQNHGRFLTLIEEKNMDLPQLTKRLKEVIDMIRESILKENWYGHIPGTNEFINEIFEALEKNLNQQHSYTLENVINATGTILHTNLGRARLSSQAVSHVVDIAKNYSNLEYNLEKGERGSRHSHVEALIKELTGAEAAMIVNNNAAAVYLVLRAFAANKEVIVSRGQLVEIGGSFRISAIMEESGAKLVEVGTTNKTHLYDYENAITPETAIIMKVHTSNFKVIGFTKSVETSDLIRITKANEHTIFYEDLGSGALFDFRKHGIGDEPVVKEVLDLGADLVTFSGDKLLGGPQAGIIAGKKSLIDRLKKHQLARVVRVDKMTLAALEGTLLDYARSEKSLENIPTIRDLLQPIEKIEARSQQFIKKLTHSTSSYETEMFAGTSQVGGGTMPEVELPTMLIALKHVSLSAEQMSRILRTKSKPSIIGRIQKEKFLIDLRTVSSEEEESLLEVLIKLSPLT
ncbi:MAG TPA: L-seryl-tRNA(Sec) selenium transferase [Bacillales bacterium]|nr:L-seryl-tRNA(Sec) selenium transferase [Bacillales bacterium]